MANVDIRLGHKNTVWFTTNSTLVLKDGQMVVCSDGANQGKYKIGDGTTQLSALTFYGGVSVSPVWGSITGTLSSQTDLQTALNAKQNTITTGTITQYLRGDLSLATFPTNVSSFTNDSGYITGITSGMVTSALGYTPYNSTNPNGYITSAALSPYLTSATAASTYLTIANAASTYQPLLGFTAENVSNKATSFTILNNTLYPTTQAVSNYVTGLGYITSSALTPYLTTASAAATYQPIGSYLTSSAIGVTVQGYSANTTLLGNSTTGSGSIVLATSPTFGTSVITPNVTGVSGNLTLTNAIQTSGAITQFTFTNVANTGQTASTNIPNFRVNGSTKTWAAGTITNQYWNYFTANTAAFASASTITNSYGLYVEAATAGTNATITNNYAAGFGGAVQITGAVSMVGIINTGNASFSGFLNMNSQPIRFLAGTAASPGLYFESNTCGIFSSTANVLGFSTSGTSRITISTTDLTISDAFNISFNATTGSKIGTATTQKLAFWNATPIVQPANTDAIDTLLVNIGLQASGGTMNFFSKNVDVAGLVSQSRIAAANHVVSANNGAIVIRKFTINSGIKLIINSGATLRIL